MGIFMKGSFIKGVAMVVEFTITLRMGGMKGTGLMESTMGMELRVGRGGADTGGSIGRG